MIHILEPFITYGYPSFESVSKLIYKRGYLKINRQRIPIENNKQIEAQLGQYGIV